MKRINQLLLNNIGAFEEKSFDFNIIECNPNIHIFTGKNSTGKTTILHALASAFDWFEKDHEQHRSSNLYKKFRFFQNALKAMAQRFFRLNLYRKDKIYCPMSAAPTCPIILIPSAFTTVRFFKYWPILKITLVLEETNKIIEKICAYGCKNIHQNFEKIVTNYFSIGEHRSAYRNSPNNIEVISYKSAINAANLNHDKTFSLSKWIDRAMIYILKNDNGDSKLEKVVLSETGNSYISVYETILGVKNMFGLETIQNLKRFSELDTQIVRSNFDNEVEFIRILKELLNDGAEVTSIISSKIFRIKRIIGKDYFDLINGKAE